MALTQAQDGIAIRAQNIGKRYRIYAHPRDRLKDVLGYRPVYSDFWALQNVSFHLRRGQVAGLVGRNGSGKTTLLQILAGVTQPTTGRASVCGRTAAILELGSGFDPEQTGRENALLYGQVMGMPRAEILDKLPAIERFADIGEFFDRPVKLYSAGMHGRLAFAVCAFVDADLLLIDEALSVGDGAFQRKCFSKIREVRERGATILFATHDTNAVRLVCDVAMMLEGGQLRSAGDPAGVVDEYLSLLLNGDAAESKNADAEVHSVPAEATSLAAAFSPDFLSRVPAKLRFTGDGRAAILGDRRMEVAASMILDGEGQPAASLGVGELCTVRSLIRFRAPTGRFWFGVLIRDRVGQAIFGQQQSNTALGLKGPFQPGDLVAVDFRFCCELRQDTYFVSLGLGDQDPSAVFFYASDAMELPVEVKGTPLYGVTNLPYEFKAQAISPDCASCPAGG